MERLMLGLGDLTGLDIIAAAEAPWLLIERPGRARPGVAAARDVALSALRRLRSAASSDGRCRVDASRGRAASPATGAPRAI